MAKQRYIPTPSKAVKGESARKANMLVQELMNLPPYDRYNIDQLHERFQTYLDLCMKYEVQVTNMTCYAAMGVDKTEVSQWVNGHRGTKQLQDFWRYVKQVCAANREILVSEGALDPTTNIWWQKNHDGYQDVAQVQVQVEHESYDPDLIRQKYLEEQNVIEAEIVSETTVGGVKK